MRAALLAVCALLASAAVAVGCQSTPYGEEKPDPPAPTRTKSSTLPDANRDSGTPIAPPASPVAKEDGAGAAPSAPTKTPGAPNGPGTGTGTGTESDAGTASDAGAGGATTPAPGDAGSAMCPRPMPAAGYLSKGTTPRTAGACAANDVGFYEGLLAVKGQTYGGLEKAMRARNVKCANCIFSRLDDSTWGPAVLLPPGDNGFFNWGACYTNGTGGNAKCGDEVQQWFDCLDDVCAECGTAAEVAACQDKVAADPKSCGGLKFDSCGAALTSLNGQCDTAAKAIAVSCQ